MIRVLIADDQQSVRRGLRMRLELESDVTVVGEAADGRAAVGLTRLLSPQVVIMDVEMPEMDGIAATQEVRRISPSTAVVVLSFYDDVNARSRAKQAGACAFVAKSRIDEALLTAIRAAAEECSGAA
jgi:DNA-binding NarL/FixJ family response regulator